MTQHPLAPSWVVLKYTSNGHQHKALLPTGYAAAPTPGVEPDIIDRIGGSNPATTKVTEYVNLIKAFFNTGSTFDSFECYHQSSPTSAPLFIFAAPLGINGTSATAPVAAGEGIFTFKTAAPGGLKLYLMEGVLTPNFKEVAPYSPGSPERALNTYILSNDNWITGRNNLQPLVGLFMTSKMNDHLRRRYIL